MGRGIMEAGVLSIVDRYIYVYICMHVMYANYQFVIYRYGIIYR